MTQKNRHLGIIAQLHRAISSQLRHLSTTGKKLVKHQYVLHMSWQYGELRPTSDWDRSGSLGHPYKFQPVLRLGSVGNVMLYHLWFRVKWNPVDNVRAVMTVRRIRRKIIRTVLCCIVYVHSDIHTHNGQFLRFRFNFSFTAALCNRAGHIYFHPVVCFSFFFFFPRLISPNLSGRRLHVCHTSTHGVALVRI